jgi:ABC-type multidrug transport system fused ATPase/permease subunit
LELQQLFHGTVKENILMGREYDQVQLDFILELVQLKEFIYHQPLGMEMVLQPEGKGLSKTLAHQILLARGFVGQPKALIMEDVLRYVQPTVRQKVIDHIIKGPWTLIMVSDDEDVQKLADEIIVMRRGKLVFQGDYEAYKKRKI